MGKKKTSNNGTAEPVTLKVLAAHLKLDPATVSVVLNNVPGRSIPEVTRERIRSAAQKFNYQPSFVARSLRNRRTMTIGILVPVLADGYHTEVMSGIGDHLLEEKNDLLDRLLRRQAEFDNFRRRAERERADTLEYANTETVRSILPILDDFERALKLEPNGKEYVRGMELIYQRLSDSLKKLGLEPINTQGLKFDPHVHHAVEMAETDEVEDHARSRSLSIGNSCPLIDFAASAKSTASAAMS